MAIIKVKTGGITADAITSTEIADNAVVTAAINADAVTDAKIADDVVGTEHLTANEVDTAALGADAVTAAQIADDAISEEHLDVTAITGHTAETSIADGDTLLIHDASASALRKMTKANFVSGIGGTNTPAFEATFNRVTGVTDNTYTKGNYTTETFDTDGKYDTTNKRFTPTVAGKYYIYANAIFDAQGVDKFHSCEVAIYKNGSIYRKSYFDQYDNYLAYGKTPFLGTIVDMDTDDYVEAYYLFNVTTGTNHNVDNGGVFGGYKLIT